MASGSGSFTSPSPMSYGQLDQHFFVKTQDDNQPMFGSKEYPFLYSSTLPLPQQQTQPSAFGSPLSEYNTPMNLGKTEPQKPKQKKPRKINLPFSAGPSNKEQFQHLFAMAEQMKNYIASLENQIKQLTTDNNNLKSMIALSNIAPSTQPRSVSAQQLPTIYNEKVQQFMACMK